MSRFRHYNPANGPRCTRCGGAFMYCGCPDMGIAKVQS